jgi:hypothetical protein
MKLLTARRRLKFVRPIASKSSGFSTQSHRYVTISSNAFLANSLAVTQKCRNCQEKLLTNSETMFFSVFAVCRVFITFYQGFFALMKY